MAVQQTTVRTSLYKTDFPPVLDGRAVEKSRENRSSGNQLRSRGDGRHGCHEVLAHVSGRERKGPPILWHKGNVVGPQRVTRQRRKDLLRKPGRSRQGMGRRRCLAYAPDSTGLQVGGF